MVILASLDTTETATTWRLTITIAASVVKTLAIDLSVELVEAQQLDILCSLDIDWELCLIDIQNEDLAGFHALLNDVVDDASGHFYF